MSLQDAIAHLIANRHNRAGVTPIGDQPLLLRDAAYDVETKLKAELLAQHGDEVLAIASGQQSAFCVLAAQFGAADFTSLCLNVQEDLLLLAPDGGGMRLIGGGLFFPSKWALSDKVGKMLGLVHGPVPGYDDKLAPTVNRLLTRLPAGQTLLRHNWTLHDDGALFQHPRLAQNNAPAASPDRMWFRSERQTLSRVEGAETILFTIKTVQARLPDAIGDTPALADFLRDEIAAMDDRTLAYKSLINKRAALLSYLG
ncbi:MAG: heme-dependent oxidative N-demethylase subunit alpha family protein [Alphaproteobacteria bacterium]